MRLSIAQITEFSRALTIVPARDSHHIIQRLSWDSRTVQPDMLFVALPGDGFDGNDFIIEAFERGAAVVIASRQVTEAERLVAEQYRAALLYASDGQLALQRLASAWREMLDAKVVGITGSSGKTSTKALVSAILARAYLTVSSLGNRNNEIGLPATVLSASPSTEVLVVEMAMRGFGQIEELCAVARPHIGIVTNIGPVHLATLGSKDNVACAKAELVAALPRDTGIAILNGDDPYTPRIRELAQTFEREVRVMLFGLERHNDIRATNIDFDSDGQPSFDLLLPDGDARRVKLNLQGKHSVYNALAAATAGVQLEVDPSQIVWALEQVKPVPMRQVRHELEDGTLVIDDSYNANPDSMRAALELLGRLPKTRLRIAILGDMGELGVEEIALHEGIGEAVYLNEVDLLVTIGAMASHYGIGAQATGMDSTRIISCSDIEEAMTVLVPLREKAPIMLVKASRFMGLERVVDYLIQGYQPPPVVTEAQDGAESDGIEDAAEGGAAEGAAAEGAAAEGAADKSDGTRDAAEGGAKGVEGAVTNDETGQKDHE
ncbi:MAG: UDP-N-acetylmuramoyl-tripeptide--D-alanyl-D-alanine ligase [Coriobacteriales bacterium]|jgi:UDP-N-acetylmuramoyl-tripeptide--D-alanyl-D-alanine ligase|nr:UDP-N-acetylmuramoyl-tripeptide--D-alanyl-D-alanine ligase [Coriobacteriales bacterium]